MGLFAVNALRKLAATLPASEANLPHGCTAEFNAMSSCFLLSVWLLYSRMIWQHAYTL